MPQGSDKQCRLTDQGLWKLEDALAQAFGDRPSDTSVADTYSLDRGTVGKLRNRREGLNRSSIERLFEPLGLDLLDEDYESVAVAKSRSVTPNPFENNDLWGCDELLRQVFEQLGRGNSQALIGAAGCGKSEILRQIGAGGEQRLQRSILTLNMHLVRDERSFFDRLCHCFELEPVDSLSRVPMQIERELKRRKQNHVLCLDEIHVLTNEQFFPESTRNWLRGMATEVYRLQLVVASQRELRQLFLDGPMRNSPLADFFDAQTQRLSYWSKSQLEGFLTDRLQGTGVTLPTATIEQIWEQSQGQPKRVRELARDWYDRVAFGADHL